MGQISTPKREFVPEFLATGIDRLPPEQSIGRYFCYGSTAENMSRRDEREPMSRPAVKNDGLYKWHKWSSSYPRAQTTIFARTFVLSRILVDRRLDALQSLDTFRKSLCSAKPETTITLGGIFDLSEPRLDASKVPTHFEQIPPRRRETGCWCVSPE